MPVLIPVDQLESGIFLARNIVNDYSTMLPHGNPLPLLACKFHKSYIGSP